MQRLDESPVPVRPDTGRLSLDARRLQRLAWGSITLLLLAIGAAAFSAKVTQDAANNLSYLDACVDTAWWRPFLASVVFGASALGLSIAWIVVARRQRHRRQTLLASLTCVACAAAGALGAGLLMLAHFCM